MKNTVLQGSKQCYRCKEVKGLSEYGKNARTGDGKDFYCRSCVCEAARRKRQKNREISKLKTEGTKICCQCKQELAITQFWADCYQKDGRRINCKKCQKKLHDIWLEKNKAAYDGGAAQSKACSICKIIKPADEYHVAKNLPSGLAPGCKACAKEIYLKLRVDVLSHYSGSVPRCLCCGETAIEFLSIDHVNGGGREHLKSLGRSTIYQWLKKNNYPDGFQTLCHNCNLAKGFYGICPHQRRRQALRERET